MTKYDVIVEQTESTVVSSYEAQKKKQKEYQSEADMERLFIEGLRENGYEYLEVESEEDLIVNIRAQLEKLNDYKFSNKEWRQICDNYLINLNEGIVEKTRKVQEDYIYNLKTDKGLTQNIKIIDKNNIHNNRLQVINQLAVEGQRKNIYDVTILVNGLPLVHVELKRRGVNIKEAFNQIRRYSMESFGAGRGLYQYVQIFIISNGTYTKYYSNTTREQAYKENKNILSSGKKTSHSFEFTTYWADANNKIIGDLEDFTKTFFTKHTLLNILTKYCVFTADNMLLVMRPYQIVATERLVNRVYIILNDKGRIGTIDAGGYIWHTTGSGKTLTSFKAARIVTEIPEIKKVLFVVDRRDLDYQTMKEYDKFESGAANSNISTAVLQKQLENIDSKIIITTIQKLSNFVKKNKKHNIYYENVVLIFDECHRSQFGEMHALITKAFKKYFVFGFTGTPIFAVNRPKDHKHVNFKTTEQVFGEQLHIYTIVDAINDGNVLPFRVDYVNTFKVKEGIKTEEVEDIQREETLLAPQRIKNTVEYILTHFDQKTNRNTKAYEYSRLVNIEEVAKRRGQVAEKLKKHRITGFNSIFATASIEAAKRYYAEFKQQQALLYPAQRIKIALIYSWNPNEDRPDMDAVLADENPEDLNGLDQSSRDFLENAIKDYNEYFDTNYNTSSDSFQNYYKDVSLRMKDRQIDLLIVVNMFLTGFDATTLNTLWIDKNVQQHGLIQAFSRTNRILNSVKTYGNIVSFRNLEERINEAVAIFGSKDAKGIVILKKFKDYYYGDETSVGYKALIEELLKKYPLEKEIIKDKDKMEFVLLFNKIIRLKNILQAFDDFIGKEILEPFDWQNYNSKYLKIYEKPPRKQKEIIDDLVFEIELIKSVEVDIDYILMMVEQYLEQNTSDVEILGQVNSMASGSHSLRNKLDLIMNFVQSLNVTSEVVEEWGIYIEKMKQQELNNIISEENLNPYETNIYISQAFASGEVKSIGTGFTKILPPTSIFEGANRTDIKERVLAKINNYFDRFYTM